MHRKLTDQEKKAEAKLSSEEKKLLNSLADDDATLYLMLTPNQRQAISQMDLRQRRSWLDEFQKKADWAKGMRMKIKEELYPLICDIDGSLEETKQFIGMLEMYISQASINYTSKMPLQCLELLENLDEKYPYKNAVISIVNLLKYETVSDVTMIVNGFNKMIDAILKKEERERSFKDLKIEWEKV